MLSSYDRGSDGSDRRLGEVKAFRRAETENGKEMTGGLAGRACRAGLPGVDGSLAVTGCP